MLNISDPSLWGNEAAEDEDPEILDSYFVSLDAFDRFFDPDQSLVVVHARKGMGKSALLQELALRLSADDDKIVVNVTGAGLSALRPMEALEPAEHVNDWHQRLCWYINRQLGSEIGLALNDDAACLVDVAELSGVRRRNLVSHLISRLKTKVSLGGISIEPGAVEPADHAALFARYAEREDLEVWLLIDDIDATFIDSPENRLRVSTFLTACRALANDYKGIRIRTCVRADVWTTILPHDEALDKVDQYLLPIHWSINDIGQLLSRRVLSYADRKETELKLPARVKEFPELTNIFPSTMPWRGNKPAKPHRILSAYANGRPRWLLQLCRMAARRATDQGQKLIKIGHINSSLEDFGRLRLADLGREHSHQCEMVRELANSFYRSSGRFRTEELLEFIAGRVGDQEVEIDGAPADALRIAKFLYRVGFLIGAVKSDGGTQYVRYEAQPDLLSPLVDDSTVSWGVTPGLKAVLAISD